MPTTSTTTTLVNPSRSRQVQPPRDYDLLLSGGNTPAAPASPTTTSSRPATRLVPREGWPTDYNEVPQYRPANRNLDFETRPNGSNTVESVFITTMFLGVNLIASVDALWRKTGGRVNPNYFRYQIGGEW